MQWLQQSQPLFYLPGEQVKQNKVGKTLAVVSSSPNIHLNENWKKTERQLFLSSDYCNHQDKWKVNHLQDLKPLDGHTNTILSTIRQTLNTK